MTEVPDPAIMAHSIICNIQKVDMIPFHITCNFVGIRVSFFSCVMHTHPTTKIVTVTGNGISSMYNELSYCYNSKHIVDFVQLGINLPGYPIQNIYHLYSEYSQRRACDVPLPGEENMCWHSADKIPIRVGSV